MKSFIFLIVSIILSFVQAGYGQAEDANGVNAVLLRDRIGERFRFVCLQNFQTGSVWGTGRYTDDSSVCTAAVHAGVITNASGGVVTIEIRPGALTFKGSVRNGIESRGYGRWDGSFVFVSDRQAPASAVTEPDVIRVRATWDSRMTNFRGRAGQRVLVICPAGERTSGPLWGTNVYSDDSAVCLAGVHAGVITKDGGEMMVEIQGSAAGFGGSMQNGVSSYSFGQWPGSFTVIKEASLKRNSDCTLSLRAQK